MVYILDNEGVAEYLCVDFTYDSKVFGKSISRSLIKGGEKIDLDETNKQLYVSKYF